MANGSLKRANKGGERLGGEMSGPLFMQCVMRSRTGTSATSVLPVRFQAGKIFLSTNRKSHFLYLIISQECVMITQLFNSLIFQLNVFTCVQVLADLSRRKLLKLVVIVAYIPRSQSESSI